jgi:hypothetical protein
MLRVGVSKGQKGETTNATLGSLQTSLAARLEQKPFPCLALQVTTTLLCIISGIAVYQNSRYTQLRLENTPLPSSITKRHSKHPYKQ